jgi:hypothetical protein
MYLEMLQQSYGDALEKQACMEKQALNAMQLIQMGRRFAARGKLDRFEQLIAKRNKAVAPASDTFNKRIRRAVDELAPKAYLERQRLGRFDGPVSKQYTRAIERLPYDPSTTGIITWHSKNNPDAFINMVNMPYPIGEVSHSTLADWAYRLRNMGL